MNFFWKSIYLYDVSLLVSWKKVVWGGGGSSGDWCYFLMCQSQQKAEMRSLAVVSNEDFFSAQDNAQGGMILKPRLGYRS